jgi:NSS family neurotransmitter:Na+ symporter
MRMAGGFIFGPLFFLLLSIAALTSTISLLEVPVTYFVDEKKWNRKKAAILVGIITLAVGIPSALSPKFLGTMNFIWGNLALSIGALFIAIFVGYIWKSSNALKEIAQGSEKFKLGGVWVIFIKFITPLAVLLVLVVGILILGLRF